MDRGGKEPPVHRAEERRWEVVVFGDGQERSHGNKMEQDATNIHEVESFSSQVHYVALCFVRFLGISSDPYL